MADQPWEILWESADDSPDPGGTRREAWGLYMASREWAVLKRNIFTRSEGRCDYCGVRPAAQVHHRTYNRRFHESLGDLWAVCVMCHLYISGKIDVDPRPPHPGALDRLLDDMNDAA